MLKLLPILFSVVINITNVNIFEIEGIFSSGHINALERYVEESKDDQQDLFIVQYNASDINLNSVEDLEVILNSIDIPKAIWVGPNKREVKMSILKNFDFVGLSPGTVVTTDEGVMAFGSICESNTCSESDVLIDAEEGIYQGYLVVGSIGAFVERLGSQDITSRLRPMSLSFNLSSEEIDQIRFIKPSLFERFYIAISNPVFAYLFFALGFALIGLELFAIGPGLMAFIGALLISFSSMTFYEYDLNYSGLIIFLASFLIFIKVLSRGFFGLLGITALIILHSSSLIMFSDYLLQINHFLLVGSSLAIAFFYYIAIPTVIRSRLTTDTSAMSSLVNSEVTLLEIISNNQALVKLNGKKLVVGTNKSNSYILKNEYQLFEEDGKLII
jgi:membrane-bound ClpP family serine protease